MSKVNRRKKYVVMVTGSNDAYIPSEGLYSIVYVSPRLEKKYSNIVVKERRPSDFKVGDITIVRRTGEKFEFTHDDVWQIWEVVDE